jgi:hypothetical protein
VALTPADIPDIRKRLLAWDTTYYATAAALTRAYPAPEVLFPEWLLDHPRLIRVLVTTEAVVAFTLQSESSDFSVGWSDLSVSQVTEHVVGVESGPVDFEMVGVRVQRTDSDGAATWESDWEKLRVFDDIRANTWNPEKAELRATADVLAFVTRQLLGIDGSSLDEDETPIEAKQASADVLRDLVAEFERLLVDATREEELQVYLKEHPELLDLRAISVEPKVPLGAEYVTDFVLRLPDDHYVLVEIERASHALYTQASNPTAAFSHAVQQVQDWLDWSYEHLSYLRQRYPEIHQPQGLVVIGRRESMTVRGRRALRRHNAENSVRVITYDDLLDGVRAIANNLDRSSGSA